MLPMSPTRRPIVPPSSRSFRMRTSSSLRRHLQGGRRIGEGAGPSYNHGCRSNCAGSQCAPRRTVSLLSALCGRAGADAGRGDDGVAGISRLTRRPERYFMPEERHLPTGDRKSVRLFLCGEVMCGRGIDQVLAHPCSPEICEHYVRSAEGYVLLAEQANGPIPRRNGSSYVWGAALGQLERMQPDARIINLETAVTRSHDRANKGINYRVSPEKNVSRLP